MLRHIQQKRNTKTISIIIFHPSTKYSRQHGANWWREREWQWGRVEEEYLRNSYYINYIFALYESEWSESVGWLSVESNFVETENSLEKFSGLEG